MNFDVFNGDADGILALLQLRLAQHNDTKASDAALITGIKRDVSLVKQIPLSELTPESKVTILDVSMEKNIDALSSVLKTEAEVLYIDHHRAGSIPNVSNLDSHIDLSADTCTALIVDKLLEGQFHLWAITAAYGDNLVSVADQLAKQAELSETEAEQLKELGTLINYNGYGAHTDDLAYHPADLYQALLQYPNPFDCISDSNSPFHVLKAAFDSDFAMASQSEIKHVSEQCLAVLLADEPWSRRISGTYGNHLANQSPDRAHVVLTTIDEDHYLVSLRAPLNNKTGAGEICSQFETGGGRAGAAGINKLPKKDLCKLITTITSFYG